MNFDYEYGYQTLPNTVNEETVATILMMVLGVLGVILLVTLIFALLRSWSLYTIAKRRGIRKAWLSWLPIGCDWILGSLSDQYQHLALGQIKSRRKILLTLNLLAVVVSLMTIPSAVMEALGDPSVQAENTFLLLSTLPGLLSSAVSITAMVFYHMSNYDLYRSCDPKNAVAFLVIGIIFSVTEPFFYLVNRKKDEGMPQPAPETPEIPAQVTVEPMGPEL